LISIVHGLPRLANDSNDLALHLLQVLDLLLVSLIGILNQFNRLKGFIETSLAIFLINVHNELSAISKRLQLFHLLQALFQVFHQLLLMIL